MYVDDCLMFAKTADIIDKLIASLRTEFTLTDEGDVAMGFWVLMLKIYPMEVTS